MEKRKIVCLCGSTRFKEAFEEANKRETIKGNIVLSVGWFGHLDAEPMSLEQKEKLDKLHLDKVKMADEILILNVGGYIGESTHRELAYAYGLEKIVSFLEK